MWRGLPLVNNEICTYQYIAYCMSSNSRSELPNSPFIINTAFVITVFAFLRYFSSNSFNYSRIGSPVWPTRFLKGLSNEIKEGSQAMSVDMSSFKGVPLELVLKFY
jgi:hypothetical protein